MTFNEFALFAGYVPWWVSAAIYLGILIFIALVLFAARALLRFIQKSNFRSRG
jgi:hypothetical protein